MIGFLLWCLVSATADAGTLDRALLGQEMADILAEIDFRKYDDVGVLPFKVKKGNRPASYTAAPLCQELPRRIENALAMSMKVANPRFEPVGILRDVAGTATEAKVGSYTKSAAAFEKLFEQRYRLAWGNAKETRKASAFLHGTVESVGDRRKTVVKVELFDRGCWNGKKIVPRKTWEIAVRTDRPLLADLGYGFSLARSAFGDGGVTTKDRDEAAVKQAAYEDEQAKPPASAGLASAAHAPADVGGFAFELRYDGKPAKLERRKGGHGAGQPEFEAAPAPAGSRITMHLTRKDYDDVLKGVVLMVNGKSTLEEQSGDPQSLRRWTFATDTGGKAEEWEGFYYGDRGEKKKLFKALTPRESVDRAPEYGTHAGWIHVYVFVSKPTGKPGAAPPKLAASSKEKEEYETVSYFSTRSLPAKPAATFTGLRDRLMTANRILEKKNSPKPRAMMRNGALIVPEVEALPNDPFAQRDFPHPELIASLAIRYYSPGGREMEKKSAEE